MCTNQDLFEDNGSRQNYSSRVYMFDHREDNVSQVWDRRERLRCLEQLDSTNIVVLKRLRLVVRFAINVGGDIMHVSESFTAVGSLRSRSSDGSAATLHLSYLIEARDTHACS